MRVRALLVTVGAAAALFVGGCTSTPDPVATPTPGLEAEDAQAIMDAANEVLFAADSFRVTGSGESDGNVIELDVVFAGEDLRGTITAAGITFEMIEVDGDSYFKGGDQLFEQILGTGGELEAVLEMIAGKWVKLPAGQDMGFRPEDVLKPTGELTKGEVTEVNGRRAIIISDEAGDFYILLDGEPYPVKYETDEGTLEITDIGKDVLIRAPAADEVFDLSTFAG